MQQWHIVEAHFPFTDFRGSKARKVLIISSDKYNVSDCLIVFITSKKKYDEETDIQITKDHPEFSATGLTKDSTIRVGKMVTCHKNLMSDPLGKAGSLIQKAVKEKLKLLFDL